MEWSDAALERRMREGWKNGLAEGTPCGGGCLAKYTTHIREWLPAAMRRYGIKSVCDAGAGDMCWIAGVFDGVEYKPFDLVPRTPRVTKLDIATTALPKCDAIICRAVLIHLDPDRVARALELFRQSAKYLFATTDRSHNRFDPHNQFNALDLTKMLGEPLEYVQDLEGKHSRLALWELDETTG